MDNRRLFVWIAVSVAILLVFQAVQKHFAPPPAAQSQVQVGGRPVTAPKPSNTFGVTPSDAGAAPIAAPDTGTSAADPRLAVASPRLQGSIDLKGARLDDLVLRDYRETLARNSPLVRLFEPRGKPQPYYAQFGWSAPAGASVVVPADDTVWAADGATLSPGHPVTLHWDNKAGLVFRIVLSLDADYMFAADQQVENHTGTAVSLFPWSRIRRDYTPAVAGTYVSFEGMTGVLNGTLHELKYTAARKDAATNGGIATQYQGAGGWAGITDKYWLAALVPDQSAPATASFRADGTDTQGGYQVDFAPVAPMVIAAGATGGGISHLFAGAKVVGIIQKYQDALHIPAFWKAVDFGLFWFLTRPFFYCIDWLFHLTGNFGVAILIFTVLIKTLFFPLAWKAYSSMNKTREVGPKLAAIREKYKDEPARLQTEMLALYRAEGINPVGSCLPMVVQIPVFFSLYKVIYVTIEMRQAPFFGWIRDLSSVDPTNFFNLFGLVPFDPSSISPALHLGIWPVFMGFTMWLTQRLNPPPPDPMQARLFQFMPIIFTFMMGRFPAGLVIYWSWNNLLTAAQQWFILRRGRAAAARKLLA